MPQSLETGKFDKYIGGKYFKDIGVCVCVGWGGGGGLINWNPPFCSISI